MNLPTKAFQKGLFFFFHFYLRRGVDNKELNLMQVNCCWIIAVLLQYILKLAFIGSYND